MTTNLGRGIVLVEPDEPVDEIDALASKITFGHDPRIMRDLMRVAMNDAAGDLGQWSGDFGAWEDELDN